MSLQVWLPLNGNLSNQGLSDITFTNQGTIVTNASGKIGSCYSRDVKQTTGRIISNSKTLFDSSISICCWAYVTDCVGDTANGLVTLHSHKDNANVGITVKQYSSTDYRISCNTGTGSKRTYCTYYGTTNIKNTWSHLSLTYDKVSKVLKLYVNGSCEYTLNNYTNYVISDNIILFDWSTTFDNSEYRPACKLNDVRIYDHCLSAKEVKEISKGLICHYKLDNNGFGNPNLLVTQSPASFSRQGSKYVNTVADTRTNDTFNLQYYRGSTYVSTFFGKDVSTTPCDVKTTFTVPENMTGIRVKFNGASRDLELFRPDRAPVVAGETYTFSLKVLSSKSETVGGVQVENPKLEKGSVVTPWCPHTSDSLYTSLGLDSITESDCSGYSRNANKANSPTSLSGSPRYEVGCRFTGSEYLTFPNPLTSSSTDFSISCWVKFDNTSDTMTVCTMRSSVGSGIALFRLGSNIFRFDDNTQTTFSSYSVPANTWIHLVVTRSASSKNLYVNGNLVQSTTTVGDMGGLYTTGSIGASSASGGGFGNFTKGAYSDFRIYATALSATDIKELYNTSASIDKNGNMYTYEFKEE